MLQEMVEVVWIRAKDAPWSLPGCPPGVYPIRPITGTWYIDRNAWLAQLQTHRKQLPLLPGFACTANAAQGGNWSAAITDINIAGGMSPQAAYVSLSRVREKKAIWILRPFPRHRFSKPARGGPDLLLKQLRGETVVWDTVAEEFGKNRKDDKSTGTPHLHCGKCGRLSPCENFTLEELMQGAARRCVACLEGMRCKTCNRATGSGICQACAGLRPCLQCCRWRLPSNFGNPQRPCFDCHATCRALACGRCTLWKPLLHFRRCAAGPQSHLQVSSRRRCDACWEEEEERQRRSHVVVAGAVKRSSDSSVPTAKRARTGSK